MASSSPTPHDEDASGTAAFWEDNWNAGGSHRLAPGEKFDKETPSPLLLHYLEQGLIPSGKALVPGCGRGYDVAALAAPDREVVGLDVAPTGVAAAREYLSSLTPAPAGRWRVEQADFFSYEGGPVDFIYDYTFLCALPVSYRERWARQMRDLLRPGGLLLTLIFPICDKEGGPPFKVSLELLRSLLEPVGFRCMELRELPPSLCHPGRDGTGQWGARSGVGRWIRGQQEEE